ncbi:hypothetical protein SAMN02745244_02760 [Tessaracoccus bendigoensis DSM 12906]|uniref:Uncharacterized protein n=1 Tax=Tessaracoccus bendigoensis DSM 12906 TaxID=1123357 RepID=A0A1M6K996_9ACTN|nr:hypothetical protein [Tessaracoccus bendigoensis]SHJ55558.1 hypothetical protein SAMN02745244_02760 [Tessaracoccus bendigoensis DSM 12906]
MGAANVITGEKYPAPSEAAQKAIEHIDWSGNHGWTDKRDSLTVGQARQGSDDARAAGRSNMDIYGAMVSLGYDEKSLDKLMAIIGAN